MKASGMHKSLIKNHPKPILIVDAETSVVISVNEAAVKFYGYKEELFIGMHISMINTYASSSIVNEVTRLDSSKKHLFKLNHQLSNGSIVAVNVMSYPVVFDDKQYLFSMVFPKEDEIPSTEFDLFSAFQKSDDAICILDGNNIFTSKIMTSNLAFNKLMQLSSIELSQVSLDTFIASNQLSDDGWMNLNEFNAKIRALNSDEDLQATINVLKLRYAGKEFFVMSFKPLNYYNLSSQLNHLSFEESIIKHGLNESGHLIKVSLFMNTNFEDIFETLSHQLENKLKCLFEDYDVPYYMVNDYKNLYVFSTGKLSEIYVILNNLIEDIEYSKEEYCAKYHCRCRIGISSSGLFSHDQITSLDEIMNSFSIHEYNTIHVHSKKTSYFRTRDIKNGIKEAVKENQFVLYAQAIVNIDENNIEGYEMLIRWEHPTYGLVMPNDFIPHAEFSGEIYKIDLWVVENTFNYIRDHLEETKTFIFHINVSTKTLSNRGFIEHVVKLSYGIPIENIVFEITEDPSTKLMDVIIDELRELGFQLAIDDFGKGYSSFERIRNIGIEYVKIDKSFIDGLTENVDDVLILKAIIGMCSNLNIKVIAEGIEKVEQLEFLYARKCTRIQGYIFSKPQPVTDLIDNITALQLGINNLVRDLTSDVTASKKFYSNGRIVLQDINASYDFVTPNVSLAENLEYEFEDFVNLNMIDLIPVQYQKTFTRFVSDLSDDIGYNTLMIKLITKTKTICKVIVVIQKKAEAGNFRLYIEFLDDIEENEIELLGLSHSYLQAFGEAPSGMMILSDGFSVKKWNVSCERIFGYSQKEMIDENAVKKLTTHPQMKAMNIMLHKSLKEGLVEMVIENKTFDNRTIINRWHVNTIFDELEQTHQHICIVNDITESIKDSQKLMKINKALDQSKSIILMTDLQGNFEYVNHMFTQVTGYTSEEVIGKNTSLLSAGSQTREFYNDLWDTILSGEVWEGEQHNKKKDKGFYWCKETIYPIKDNDMITGFVGIQTDTTKEKELVSLNTNLKSKLFEQDKVASIGLLSSGIMHEINNPLSFIQGNIKYLIDQFDDYANLDSEDLEELKETIADIDSGVTQIKTIAEGLKKYIFKGGADQKEDVNLLEEIKIVLVLAKNEYKYNATIEVVSDETLIYNVKGYASKLKQVLMNLIINASHAIKAMDRVGLGKIRIELKSTPDQVWLIVEDDGAGMSEETINRIYEPFFTTKTVGVGSGLGLSVTRQIIEEDHNGLILCESKVNVGTKFIIKLFKE